MVIRELRVLLKVLCSSSSAEIIFSIWALLSGLVVLTCPVVMVPTVVLSVSLVTWSALAALVLRSQCFRNWLGDFSGVWVRLRGACGGFTKPAQKKVRGINEVLNKFPQNNQHDVQ